MKKMTNDKANGRHIFSKAIGIMALMIVMFSGVAAADQVIPVNDGFIQSITIPSQISPNTPFNVEVAFNYYPTYTTFIHIFADNNNAGIYNDNNDIGSSMLNYPVTTPTTVLCSGLSSGSHTLMVETWTGTGQYAWVSDSFSTSITVGSASVPEFPSIALPVATILGLVFIIGRKKNMV